MNRRIVDFIFYPWWIWGAFSVLLFNTPRAQAFNKLKNGFETLTESYLIPLSTAMAGAMLILYVILSYFRLDEFQKKVGSVFGLAILTVTGTSIINGIVGSFS
mgnify:CR=1 FL=1